MTAPGPPPPGVDQMLLDLDLHLRQLEDDTRADVAALRTDLGSVATELVTTVPRVGDLETVTTSLGGDVARLDTDLATLTGRVDALTPPDKKLKPISWPVLSSASAGTEWTRLADWVGGVLGPWYQVTRGQVPDCWAMHRPVLLHLSWLHIAYEAAHKSPGGTPGAAAEWHARWLPVALDAIAALGQARPGHDQRVAWAGGCRPGYHQDLTPAGDHESRRTPPSRRGHPHEVGLPSAGGSLDVRLRDDPIDRSHWDPWWRIAVRADVAERRARETAQPPNP